MKKIQAFYNHYNHYISISPPKGTLPHCSTYVLIASCLFSFEEFKGDKTNTSLTLEYTYYTFIN